MLLTVTLNPSVDISYHLDTLALNTVNRVKDVKKTAGGKGLNVTRVAHLLGMEVLATGILGGSLGTSIEHQLTDSHIRHFFLHTNQEARNCIAILHDGMQTEILEAGPTLTSDHQQAFLDHFETLLDNVTVVTMSGSIAKGFTNDIYTKLIEKAAARDIPVILDCSGQPLAVSIENKKALPYLIKPNLSELQQLLNKQLSNDPDELKEALLDDQFAGIPWIVVSQGADGAFAKHGDTFYKVHIPTIQVANPVGSGDSTVAGLAMAISNQKDDETVLKYGMTAGILNTLQPQTGFVNADQFDTYFNQISVQKL